ncbi:guanine nucleotide-binding protein alpha-2 subunit [Aspergillus udagawae]|uniref:Guanine nucleotide-binding protein alpha-2 subunit n=1 Tax=Aspergillus udagawae TaxID=91492 RepID=A0A8E0R1W4_9EURO|nr:guanine nucleotide-binding protein alpha-2 subunit [Aspergillus udagawae]GIC94610.1 guanine nucleotide-binding protein alpha-2 subunit [Aspergillus udagawae]
MDLDASINCCTVLLAKLQDLVDSLRQKQNKALDFQSKLKLVFGKKSVDDIQKLLEHQTNALSLVLAACNCQTGAEQKALLVRSSSRRVFRQMNSDSASLMVHRDTTSIATQITDHLSKVSVAFSFDREVFTSNVYERFFRGLTRRVLRYPQTRDTPVVEQPREPSGDDGWPLFQEKLLLFGSDYAGTDDILHELVGLVGNQTINIGLTLQRTAIYKFVIMSTQAIIAALNRDATGPQLDSNRAHCDLLLRYIDDLSATKPLDERIGEAIRSLWQDPSMERVRQSPREFAIPESALELFDDIDRIASPNYEPTSRDLKIVRDRTPSVIELQATYIKYRNSWTVAKPAVKLVNLQLLDVTLRFGSNVAYDFKAITTIFLLINIAGYNEFLEYDRLRSSLLHCTYKSEAMLRSSWFPQDTRVVILFREPEEFASKLTTHPFADYFPGYTEDNERDASLTFLFLHFKQLRPNHFLSGVIMWGIQSCPRDSIIEKLLFISEMLQNVPLNAVSRMLERREMNVDPEQKFQNIVS